MSYKLWLHIEEIDENGDAIEPDASEPVEAGRADTLEEIERQREFMLDAFDWIDAALDVLNDDRAERARNASETRSIGEGSMHKGGLNGAPATAPPPMPPAAQG